MIESLKRAGRWLLRKLARRPAPDAEAAAGTLTEVPEFGANPGALRMLLYVPPAVPRPGAPLVVLLHGCGQHAAPFAVASGWMAVADRLGLPLLLPEQTVANNPARCFNWFAPDDIAREAGEATSIRHMVDHATDRFQCDPTRRFVVGLSAGGAMAAALLAACPDLFAAGAVVAGLPVGCATDVTSALARMAKAGPEQDAGAWARQAQALAPPGYAGPWPRISIWHGGADRVVDPGNAANLAAQWKALHGTLEVPSLDLRPLPGVRRRAWGRAVELWTIEAMPHGFPVATPSDDRLLPDVGVDGAAAIARFWGLR